MIALLRNIFKYEDEIKSLRTVSFNFNIPASHSAGSWKTGHTLFIAKKAKVFYVYIILYIYNKNIKSQTRRNTIDVRARVYVLHGKRARQRIDNSRVGVWVCACVLCTVQARRTPFLSSLTPYTHTHTHTHTNVHVDTDAASLHRPYTTNTASLSVLFGVEQVWGLKIHDPRSRT